MRIRKNARLVVEGISSSSSTSFLICQLNRSPWDVDSFLSQVELDNNDGVALNGSLVESIPASDSMRSGESMELSFEYVERIPTQSMREKVSGGEDEEIGGLDEPTTPPFCGAVATRGPTPCDQLVKSHPATFPSKKVAPPLPPASTPPKKRGRPRKPTTAAAATTAAVTTSTTAAAANPYEFYYYSGFGPSWGKRRGGSKSSNLAAAVSRKDSNDNVNAGAYGDVNGAETPGSSSTSHEIMSEDDNEDGKNKNKVVVESVVDEELDYIDDEDDDEELYGGRRVRKPIKARSLKSLM